MEVAGTSSVDNRFTLVLTGGSSTITKMSFPDGLKLMAGGQNLVVDNYIGTDVTGMVSV